MVLGTLSQAHLWCMACSPAALVLASASSHIFSPRWRCSAWGRVTVDYFKNYKLYQLFSCWSFWTFFKVHAIWCSFYIVLNMSSYFTCWSFWTSFRPRTSLESCFDIPSKFCSILSASTFLINNLIFSYCSEEPPVYSYWFPMLIDV